MDPTVNNPSGLSSNPESAKPTSGEAWSAARQVQYVQQPYIQPGSHVQYV
jgi:hypothetical protein